MPTRHDPSHPQRDSAAVTASLYEALLHLETISDASTEDILNLVLETALTVTESDIGYIYLYDEATEVLTNFAWSRNVMPQCAVPDMPRSYQLERTGLWGEAIRQRRPIVTNDYAADNPFKKGLPEGHVPIRRHMNIPIFEEGAIIALAGVGNKASDYSELDVDRLQLLMNGAFSKLQRFRMARKLQESERLYRTVFEQAATGICQARLDGTLFEANETFCRILGYSKENLIGKNIRQLTHPEDWPMDKVLKEALFRGDIPHFTLEKRYVKEDGSAIWVSLTASIARSVGESEPYYIGIITDITEKQAAQSELVAYHIRLEELVEARTQELERTVDRLNHEMAERQRSEEDINLFFSTTLDMLCIAGFDGYFKRLSPTWSKVLGWSEEELKAVPFVQFVHPEDVAATLAAAAGLTEGVAVISFQNRYRCKDGTYKWIEWNSYGYPERSLILAAARDISERKSALQQLEEAKAETEAAYRDLRRRTGELEVLYSIYQITGETLEIEELFRGILKGLVKYLHADAVALYLYNPDTDQLNLIEQIGLSLPLVQLVQRIDRGVGLVGRAVQERKPLSVLAENHPDPEFRALILEMDIESLTSLPLLSGNRLFGAMTLLFRPGNAPTEDQETLIRAVGAQIATSISNAKLYSDMTVELRERTRLEALQSKTLEALEAERDFIKRTLSIIPQAILVIGREGVITYANQAAEALMDVRTGEAIRQVFCAPGWTRFTPEGDLYPEGEDPFEQVMRTQRNVYDLRMAVARSDDRKTYLSINGTPLLSSTGELEWAVFSIQDITSRIQYEAMLEQASITDPLTGLYNRRYMTDRITEEIRRHQRNGHLFSIIICDIDYFKSVNDRFGHDCGDQTLKTVTGHLKECLRGEDILARWGGEEFLILLPETDRNGARIVAERMRLQLEAALFTYDSHQFRLTMTFGLSEYLPDQPVDATIIQADRALFQGKAYGRNQVSG